MHILVTGAAGSGTSTFGAALAAAKDVQFLEADSYFWLPTDPSFTQKRPIAERNALLNDVLRQSPQTVVAGSVMGWGSEVEQLFGMVVFLYVPTAIRLQRLEAREIERFGKANPEFLDWAAQYDVGAQEGRSLARHNAWLASLPCRVIRLEGDIAVPALLGRFQQQAAEPPVTQPLGRTA